MLTRITSLPILVICFHLISSSLDDENLDNNDLVFSTIRLLKVPSSFIVISIIIPIIVILVINIVKVKQLVDEERKGYV